MPISIVWNAEAEARFQEWLKAPERKWNRDSPEIIVQVSPVTLEEPVSKPLVVHKLGRPPKVLSQDILEGPGSTREKGRRMGVGHMTVWRRLRQGGGTWKKGT